MAGDNPYRPEQVERRDQQPERPRKLTDAEIDEQLARDEENTRTYSAVARSADSRAQRAADGREPTAEQRAEMEALYGRSYEELLRIGQPEPADASDAPEITNRLREWQKGQPAEAYLCRSDTNESLWGDRVQTSGYEGPAKLFHPRELGLAEGWSTMSHVEAHTAATLRVNPEVRDAVLYLNKAPCKGPQGCYENFETMLPDQVKVVAYWPGGEAVFVGSPDKDGSDRS